MCRCCSQCEGWATPDAGFGCSRIGGEKELIKDVENHKIGDSKEIIRRKNESDEDISEAIELKEDEKNSNENSSDDKRSIDNSAGNDGLKGENMVENGDGDEDGTGASDQKTIKSVGKSNEESKTEIEDSEEIIRKKNESDEDISEASEIKEDENTSNENSSDDKRSIDSNDGLSGENMAKNGDGNENETGASGQKIVEGVGKSIEESKEKDIKTEIIKNVNKKQQKDGANEDSEKPAGPLHGGKTFPVICSTYLHFIEDSGNPMNDEKKDGKGGDPYAITLYIY